MNNQDDGKGGTYTRAILLIAVLQGFLFVNAVVWWGPDWPASAVGVYLFLEAIFFGWLGYGLIVKRSRYTWIEMSLSRAALMWMFGFMLTWVVVYGLFEFLLHYEWPGVGQNELMPVFVFQVMFVTPVEELIFRGILPQEVEDHERWKVPVLMLGTQALFAVYHLAAYGGLNSMMIYAFVAGVIWVYASRRWSIYWTMGSHTAYNSLVLGLLAGGV